MGVRSAKLRKKKMGNHAFTLHMRKIASKPRKPRNGSTQP